LFGTDVFDVGTKAVIAFVDSLVSVTVGCSDARWFAW